MAEIISHEQFRLCRAMREMTTARTATARSRREPPRLSGKLDRLLDLQDEPSDQDPREPPAA